MLAFIQGMYCFVKSGYFYAIKLYSKKPMENNYNMSDIWSLNKLRKE